MLNFVRSRFRSRSAAGAMSAEKRSLSATGRKSKLRYTIRGGFDFDTVVSTRSRGWEFWRCLPVACAGLTRSDGGRNLKCIIIKNINQYPLYKYLHIFF